MSKDSIWERILEIGSDYIPFNQKKRKIEIKKFINLINRFIKKFVPSLMIARDTIYFCIILFLLKV